MSNIIDLVHLVLPESPNGAKSRFYISLFKSGQAKVVTYVILNEVKHLIPEPCSGKNLENYSKMQGD